MPVSLRSHTEEPVNMVADYDLSRASPVPVTKPLAVSDPVGATPGSNGKNSLQKKVMEMVDSFAQ